MGVRKMSDPLKNEPGGAGLLQAYGKRRGHAFDEILRPVGMERAADVKLAYRSVAKNDCRTAVAIDLGHSGGELNIVEYEFAVAPRAAIRKIHPHRFRRGVRD